MTAHHLLVGLAAARRSALQAEAEAARLAREARASRPMPVRPVTRPSAHWLAPHLRWFSHGWALPETKP